MNGEPLAAAVRPCSRCGAAAVHHLAYSGEHLCASHFLTFTERRVKRDVRQQGPFPAGARIAVAVSGGKDSIATLRLLHEVLGARRDLELVAVTVDEGIAGYRPAGIDVARRAAEELGVPWRLVSYRDEAGVTMDEVVARKRDGAPCSYCGPLRRRSLNRAARDVGATHLATGHNLDDLAQTVLMNALRGDVQQAARLPPHADLVPGLVPRVLPLRSLPEREVALYAHLRGWEVHDGECPYSVGATRLRIRDTLLALEDAEPGTRQRLVAFGGGVATALRASGAAGREAPGACATCGEPAAPGRDRCRGCEMLAALP